MKERDRKVRILLLDNKWECEVIEETNIFKIDKKKSIITENFEKKTKYYFPPFFSFSSPLIFFLLFFKYI